MATADEVIAKLEQAKKKLAEAKMRGLQAVSIFGKAHQSVGHVLGRAGARSALLAEMRLKERALLGQVMRADNLIDRIDRAIAHVRAAGPGGNPTGGTAQPG